MLGSLSWPESLLFVTEKLHQTTWREHFELVSQIEQTLRGPDLQVQIAELAGIPQFLKVACARLMCKDIAILCDPDCILMDAKKTAATLLREYMKSEVS